MKAVIMGCGRVGSAVATELLAAGHEVALVDVDSSAFRLLPEGFPGKTVVGNGVDKDVLRAAGIEGADVFMALAYGDNRNAMAAQVAKHLFGVPRVIARIYDPARSEIYQELGVITVSPTTTVTKLVLDQALRP